MLVVLNIVTLGGLILYSVNKKDFDDSAIKRGYFIAR